MLLTCTEGIYVLLGKKMHLPNERYELNIHARKSIRSAPYAHRRHKHTIQSFEKN